VVSAQRLANRFAVEVGRLVPRVAQPGFVEIQGAELRSGECSYREIFHIDPLSPYVMGAAPGDVSRFYAVFRELGSGILAPGAEGR
jgi:hypothetical protein